MKCGTCGGLGHSARTCAKRADATTRLELPAHLVQTIMRERLRPLIRACAWEPNVLESIMVGCYLQGALDGARPEVQAARAALHSVRGDWKEVGWRP